MKIFGICLLFVLVTAGGTAPPVVLWHGLGDTCCNPLSLGGFMTFLSKHLPQGTPITSLKIGKGFLGEMEAGYFMNANDQVALACEQIRQNSNLTNGYNAIGFSQGGQFLRAVAQRCPTPPMLNLISLGGQHQGVFGFPKCPGDNSTICEYVRKLLDLGAYWSFVQNELVPAQYWHDPLNEKTYQDKSIFLADINNEGEHNNASYKVNLMKLKNLVLVQFADDTIVDPKETSWFDYYVPGQDKVIQDMRNSSLYTEDRIGLKVLDKMKKIQRLLVPGDHLQINETWFVNEIVPKYLL